MEQDSIKYRLALVETNHVSKYTYSAQKLCCHNIHIYKGSSKKYPVIPKY